MAAAGRRGRPPGRERSRPRAHALRPRPRRRPLGVPGALLRRPRHRTRHACFQGPPAAAPGNRRACAPARPGGTARHLAAREGDRARCDPADVAPAMPAACIEPPTGESLGRVGTAELRKLGLHARRAAVLVRLCRSVDLERLHALPTYSVVKRLAREPGIGQWSAGVVCLQGLGRTEHGLVGDLGLIKLCSPSRGRRVEAAETAALLEPYGEWAGLASVYMLAGLGRGLISLPRSRLDSPHGRAAPGRARRGDDRRVPDRGSAQLGLAQAGGDRRHRTPRRSGSRSWPSGTASRRPCRTRKRPRARRSS